MNNLIQCIEISEGGKQFVDFVVKCIQNNTNGDYDSLLGGILPPINNIHGISTDDIENIQSIIREALINKGVEPKEADYILGNAFDKMRLPEQATKPLHLPLTDLGNSERFIYLHKDIVRYNGTSGKWLVWNGKYWQQDETGRVFELAKKTVRGIYGEAENCTVDKQRELIAKFAVTSESHQRITDMLRLSKTTQEISLTSQELDKHPYLLNLENGTYNLNTHKFILHTPENLITKHTKVYYDPLAKAPQWNKFIHKIFAGNSSMISFVQRCVGYSLTGDTSEQCLFFCWGTGKNGKTVFFEVMKLLLDDYWQKAPSEMLMLKNNDSIPNDVARLQGARFVVASEIQEGRKFNEAKLKDLTGGDTLSARYLHNEFFQFKPTHKLWMYGNHKPIISGTDEGIWRRMVLIPFSVTIPENERVPMSQLLETMKAELSGILNWTLEGHKEWKRIGLDKPIDVNAATNNYRAEMDVLRSFLDECCIIKPTASVRYKDLYTSHCKWCTENGESPIKSKKFNSQMKERGYIGSTGSGNYLEWKGIGILSEQNS